MMGGWPKSGKQSSKFLYILTYAYAYAYMSVSFLRSTKLTAERRLRNGAKTKAGPLEAEQLSRLLAGPLEAEQA